MGASDANNCMLRGERLMCLLLVLYLYIHKIISIQREIKVFPNLGGQDFLQKNIVTLYLEVIFQLLYDNIICADNFNNVKSKIIFHNDYKPNVEHHCSIEFPQLRSSRHRDRVFILYIVSFPHVIHWR